MAAYRDTSNKNNCNRMVSTLKRIYRRIRKHLSNYTKVIIPKQLYQSNYSAWKSPKFFSWQKIAATSGSKAIISWLGFSGDPTPPFKKDFLI